MKEMRKKNLTGDTLLQPKVVFVQPLSRPDTDIPLSLTYDDVLLRPKRSSIRSRRDVSTRTQLSKNIFLNTPIVSANMDTVTESLMAISMAKMGGIGILHRFMSIEAQVDEVKKVKTSTSRVRKDLQTVDGSATLASAWRVMDKTGIQSLLVVDSDDVLIGILTSRDIVFENDPNKKVAELMTGRDALIVASASISSEEAKELLTKNKIEKLPIVDTQGRLKGLITAADLIKEREFPNASRDHLGRFLVGAAIGVRGDYLERAKALTEAGADVLVLDIAHGHSDHAIEACVVIKRELGVELIAGNVATPEGVRDLVAAGADAVKVGIGPGSACTTRIVAGIGVPQFSAVIECAAEAAKTGTPIIADGGVRASGDIVKALAAGAATVMAGNLLGGCAESPGETIERNGKKFKLYRGMASRGAALSRLGLDGLSTDDWFNHQVVPEGVEATVPYKGSVINLVDQLLGGVRSGMSYMNATNLEELRRHADFVRITNAGLSESLPHDLQID